MSDTKRMEQELAELQRQQGSAQPVEGVAEPAGPAAEPVEPASEPTAWERKWAEMKQREREELEAEQRKPVQPTYRRTPEYKSYQKTDWSRPLSSYFPNRRR